MAPDPSWGWLALTRLLVGIGLGHLLTPHGDGWLLGITLDVADEHYIRAGQIEASRTYAGLVEQRRKKLARAGKSKMV